MLHTITVGNWITLLFPSLSWLPNKDKIPIVSLLPIMDDCRQWKDKRMFFLKIISNKWTRIPFAKFWNRWARFIYSYAKRYTTQDNLSCLMYRKHIYAEHPNVIEGISVNIFCEEDYELVGVVLLVYQSQGIV